MAKLQTFEEYLTEQVALGNITVTKRKVTAKETEEMLAFCNRNRGNGLLRPPTPSLILGPEPRFPPPDRKLIPS